jgi:hypothetical protein
MSHEPASNADGLHRPAAPGDVEAGPNLADRRADRIWGPGWIALGVTILIGAVRIDRLEAQGVSWYAAPGLLPAVLGVMILLCGVLITLRARRATGEAAPDEAGLSWPRVLLTLALCLGFGVALVGRGLHFGVAAALYLFVHISLLQWHERGASGQRLRGLAVAAAVAIGAGVAVPYVFEQLFLVRLP